MVSNTEAPRLTSKSGRESHSKFNATLLDSQDLTYFALVACGVLARAHPVTSVLQAGDGATGPSNTVARALGVARVGQEPDGPPVDGSVAAGKGRVATALRVPYLAGVAGEVGTRLRAAVA